MLELENWNERRSRLEAAQGARLFMQDRPSVSVRDMVRGIGRRLSGAPNPLAFNLCIC